MKALLTPKEEQFILDNLGIAQTGPRNVISTAMAMALLNCTSGLTKDVTQRLKVSCPDGTLMSLYCWASAVIEEDAAGLMYGEWS